MTECGCQPVKRYLIAVCEDQPVQGVMIFGVYGTVTCHVGACRQADEVRLNDRPVERVQLRAMPYAEKAKR